MERSEIGSIETMRVDWGFVEKFSLGFKEGLNYYIKNDIIHSPIFYYLVAVLETFLNSNSTLSKKSPVDSPVIMVKRFLESNHSAMGSP